MPKTALLTQNLPELATSTQVIVEREFRGEGCTERPQRPHARAARHAPTSCVGSVFSEGRASCGCPWHRPPAACLCPWGLTVAHPSFPLPAESAALASGLEEAPGQTYGEAFSPVEAPADTARQVICVYIVASGGGGPQHLRRRMGSAPRRRNPAPCSAGNRVPP